MKRLALTGEALASVATVAVAVAAVWVPDAGHRVGGIIIAIALLWSALPLLGHVLSVVAARSRPPVPLPEGETGTVTTVIRLGREPLDVARTTILLATQAGPTVVIASDADISPELDHLGADVIEASTFGAGLAQALDEITTDAVLITSARAVPLPEAGRAAATLLTDDVGWAIGSFRPFTTDGYLLDSREPVTATLLSDARRAGLVVWEPDVTLVRTDVLREFPLAPGKPLGTWLRARRSAGLRGVEVHADLVRRAAPVDAAAYWPDTVSRQWGRVADLSGALTNGSPVARLAAASLVARETVAVPATLWFAMPILIGSSSDLPFRLSGPASLVIVVAAALFRYFALRSAVSQRPRPLRDAVSTIHSLPGSWASIGALVTRRLPRARVGHSSRPLVWGALVMTIATGYRLIDSTSLRTSTFSIVLSLAALTLLWIFSMGALVQRNWARSTYRVPLAIPLTIGNARYRTVNGSPSGVAVTGDLAADLRAGDELPVSIELDDGTTISPTAEVTGRRQVGETDVLGLSLTFGDSARLQWVNQLSRSAEAPRSPDAPEVAGRSELIDVEDHRPSRRRADQAILALVAVASLAVGSLLLLVMLGYRPLVIRSPSMVPTLDIGDVVLSQEVTAADLRPGDIANIPSAHAAGTGTLTHRVVGVTPTDGQVLVRTKGDANSTGESTLLDADQLAGRVRWTIPWIGRPATAVRTSTGQMLIGLTALLIAVAGLLVRPLRAKKRPEPEPTEPTESE